ncbi:MAG: hypothetical protein AMK73_01505 [Planctomycetes bacterium SM23_32]|nr:MAG: hypothetical protein AMK73_01505 [Planctomycetes bacterium SM23_32]
MGTVCIAALAIGELLLRVVLGLGNPPLMVKHPEIGYMFKANQHLMRFGNRIVYNQFHQRSDPASATPPQGTWRVLMIGDSVTNGGALTDQDDTISEQLERLLTDDGPVEVLAASAGSWSVGNEAAYIAEFGLLGSRTLIWQISSDDLVHSKSLGEGVGKSPSVPTERPLLAWQEMLSRYALPLVRSILTSQPSARPSAGQPASDLEAFDECLKYFAEAMHLVQQSGARCVVLLDPDRVELAEGPRYPLLRAQFTAFAQQHGALVVDLLDSWGPDEAVFYRGRVHLTPQGNRAVARRLADALHELEASGTVQDAQ